MFPNYYQPRIQQNGQQYAVPNYPPQQRQQIQRQQQFLQQTQLSGYQQQQVNSNGQHGQLSQNAYHHHHPHPPNTTHNNFMAALLQTRYSQTAGIRPLPSQPNRSNAIPDAQHWQNLALHPNVASTQLHTVINNPMTGMQQQNLPRQSHHQINKLPPRIQHQVPIIPQNINRRPSSNMSNAPVPHSVTPPHNIRRQTSSHILPSPAGLPTPIASPTSIRTPQLPIPSPSSSRLIVPQANAQAGAINLSTPSPDLNTRLISTTPEEKRQKINIRFDHSNQKQTNDQKTTTSKSRRMSQLSDTSSITLEEDSDTDAALPVLKDNTRIIIDDDIEIVGTTQAEIMSHMRADCPIHKFVRVDNVDSSTHQSNSKFCSKCFCYICDIVASKCEMWSVKSAPHCNAHAKASCWKARRNMKRSPLMNMLSADELNTELNNAGELAMKQIIRVRESYITYRMGSPCDFYDVPCNCNCHRETKRKVDCAQCKAVHDLKKKFNYEPVRNEIQTILSEIKTNFTDKPYSALILYEALLSELCSHRPADFNHVKKAPSNPNTRCQCNTPAIMNEHIETELVRIFTLHEISSNFKTKFLKCVESSIQPLQLSDIFERFLKLRHWDDLLLRAVLSGQNTSGRIKGSENLKETALIMEMRVQKLEKEKRYHAIVRYLKVCKVMKSSGLCTSDGSNITVSIEKWMLVYMAKQGKFKDVCLRLVENLSVFRSLPNEFFIGLFSLLSGKDLEPNVELRSSFNVRGNTGAYKLVGCDHTVLLLVFLIFMEVNQNAQLNFPCYLWLATWVNQAPLDRNVSMVSTWARLGADLVRLSSQVTMSNTCSRFLMKCVAIDGQVAIFTCSLLILNFMKKGCGNQDHIEAVMKTYAKNEWALFYLFTQPAILGCGYRNVILWLIARCKQNILTLAQFNDESVNLIVMKFTFDDVTMFMETTIKVDWTTCVTAMRNYVIRSCSKFAERLASEKSSTAAQWLYNVVFKKIMSKRLYNDDAVREHCDVIGKVCCLTHSLEVITEYKQMFENAQSNWELRCTEILTAYQNRFARDGLSGREKTLLFHAAVNEQNNPIIKWIFANLTEKHDCSDKNKLDIMEEVAKVIECKESLNEKQKESLILLFTKLCAHETLSWLICIKCSSNMPGDWIKVWSALHRNNMKRALNTLVQHTLQQFTSWMKELCVQEQSDIERLLHCFRIFVTNIVRTMLDCGFEVHTSRTMILETRFFIANSQLRNDYMKIIEQVFAKITQEKTSKNPVAAHPRETSSQFHQMTSPTHEKPSQSRDMKPSVHDKPLQSRDIIPPSCDKPSQRDITSPSQVRDLKAVSHEKPLQLGDIKSPSSDKSPKSRDITSQNNVISQSLKKDHHPHSAPVVVATGDSPQLRSPYRTEIAEPSNHKQQSPHSEDPATHFCPQCGDMMSSSFRCSKCHSRRIRDVKCPKCSQVNHDIKGYSCRYCYASLLQVLTQGDTKQDSETKSDDSEKRKIKKLKKKRIHSLQKLDSEKIVSKTDDNNCIGQVVEKTKAVDDTALYAAQRSTSSLKTTISLPPRRVSVEATTSEVQTDVAAVKVKRTARKNVPSKKPIHREPVRSLSDSSSSSDEEMPKIPLLVLKRHTDEDRSTVVEVKRPRVEMKHATNRGISMSKKQRDILQRMKNIGKGKKSVKSHKNHTKQPEIEILKIRKPGPASRTSYYKINPLWGIPRFLRLPPRLDLPKVCFVKLNLFTQEVLDMINSFQPNLHLTDLYA